MEYIPLIEAFQAFLSEDLFDDVSNTIVSRVGVVSLKSRPYDLVRIRSTASKHLADGAEQQEIQVRKVVPATTTCAPVVLELFVRHELDGTVAYTK